MKMRIFLFLFRRCRSKQKERWVYVVVSRERASNTILENHFKKVKPWGQIYDPSLGSKLFSSVSPSSSLHSFLDPGRTFWADTVPFKATRPWIVHCIQNGRGTKTARCGACPGQRQVSTTDANLHWVFVKNTLVSLIKTLGKHRLAPPPPNFHLPICLREWQIQEDSARASSTYTPPRLYICALAAVYMKFMTNTNTIGIICPIKGVLRCFDQPFLILRKGRC